MEISLVKENSNYRVYRNLHLIGIVIKNSVNDSYMYLPCNLKHIDKSLYLLKGTSYFALTVEIDHIVRGVK